MPYLSITRLHLKSRLMAPRFLIANEPIFKQLIQSEGYLDGKALMDFSGGAWTISLWKDKESMKKFYLSGVHRNMMPMLSTYADEGSTCTLEVNLSSLPSWKRARDLLARNANFSTGVRQPSNNHREGVIPRLWFPLLSRPLKPKQNRLAQATA